MDEAHGNYDLRLHPHKLILYLIFFGLFVTLSGWMTYPVHGSNWNQWRGSLRDGSQTRICGLQALMRKHW